MFRPVELVRVNIYVTDTHVSRVSWVLARLGLLHLVDVRKVTGGAVEIFSEEELEQRCRAIKERSKRLMDLLSLPYEPWGLEVEVTPEKDLLALEEEIGRLEQTLPPLFDRLSRMTEVHREKAWQAQVLRLLITSGIDLALLQKSHRLIVYLGVIPAQTLPVLEGKPSPPSPTCLSSWVTLIAAMP